MKDITGDGKMDFLFITVADTPHGEDYFEYFPAYNLDMNGNITGYKWQN